MSVFRKVWHALVRPRGPVSHRFYRVGRSSRSGVALLLVMTGVMLLTILIYETAQGGVIRARLAAHHRDEVKAEQLADTGLQLYRLILMTSKQFEKMLRPYMSTVGAMLGVNADSLWSLVPTINTQLLRLIFVSGGDLDADEAADAQANQGLTQDQIDKSKQENGLKHNFLDFDGDFSAHVEDESRYIYVGSFAGINTFGDLLVHPTTVKIQGLAAREEDREWFTEQNIDVNELVANLVDWTDADTVRLYQGGDEDSIYQRLEPPYKARNAPFDTLDEIRLVDGWNDDGVWQRLGKNLTIYGDGKVNVNTAREPVIRALFVALYDGPPPPDSLVDEKVEEFMRLRGLPLAEGGVIFAGGQHFVNYVENQLGYPLKDDAANYVSTQAGVFRVTSTGTVGDAKVEMQAVIDYRLDPTGHILYYRVQ
jgi:type II secretory pathway component PulK